MRRRDEVLPVPKTGAFNLPRKVASVVRQAPLSLVQGILVSGKYKGGKTRRCGALS